jgi:hypothetical protein
VTRTHPGRNGPPVFSLVLVERLGGGMSCAGDEHLCTVVDSTLVPSRILSPPHKDERLGIFFFCSTMVWTQDCHLEPPASLF